MQVKCASYNYNLNQWEELDISASLKVYPCCGYHGYYEVRDTWEDDRFKDLPPDWNDLKKNSMETIKKTMFTILNVENFNSGNCPKKCKDFCGVDLNEYHTPGRGDA